MSFKKQVLYDLRYTYSGPFNVEELYEEIDKWISEHGYEKEPKRKTEHITKEGKRIQYHIEIHTHLDDLHHGIIVLTAYMENVKDISVKKKGKKSSANKGDVMIHIDGFLESHTHGTFWANKPIFYFLRTLYDRFVWAVWADKHDGAVVGQCHDLFKLARAFFNIQKYAYE